MTDNQMMIAVIAEIKRQLTGQGIADFKVVRGMQPTNQYSGASKDDDIKTRISLYAVTKSNAGKGRIYSGGNADPKRTDTHHKGKTIQVSVLHYFDESDIDAMNTEDMADLVQQLIDSPDAIRSLRDDGVFLESVGDVRPTFTVNDKDRNESTPNFDMTVNYSNSIVKDSAVVTGVNGVVERV